MAPAPRTKIRMAWRKLYHNSRAGLGRVWRSVLKLQHTGQWRTLAAKTPTLGAYGEKTYGGRGDVLAIWPGMRVWLETAGPPTWKGANDEKMCFFVRA